MAWSSSVCNAWPYQASSKLETRQVGGGSLTREKEEAAHARRTTRSGGDVSGDELTGEDWWVVLQCSPVLRLDKSRQIVARTADVEVLERRCLLDREEPSNDGAPARLES
jgi:hypothetical protein